MPHSRIIAIGDIHGCLSKLKILLHKIIPTENDLFVFLGDYIDRGEDSPGTVEFLLSFAKKYKSEFLLGNHEQLLLDLLDYADTTFLAKKNGGEETIRQYKAAGISLVDHLPFFRSLKSYYEIDEFIFVHAGLLAGKPLHEQELEDLLWIRAEFIESPYDWNKTIVFGHTPQKVPLLSTHRIGLDTGAGYGKSLTACDVLTRTIWSA